MRYGKNDNEVYFKVFNRTKRVTRLVCKTDFEEDWSEEILGIQFCDVSIKNIKRPIQPSVEVHKVEFENCINQQIDFLTKMKLEGECFETDTFQILLLNRICYMFYSNEAGAGLMFYHCDYSNRNWRKSNLKRVEIAHKKLISKLKSFQKSLNEMI